MRPRACSCLVISAEKNVEWVARIEVSVDDGQNWQDAKIDYPGTDMTWVLWSYDWKPDRPGDYQLTVRATDRKGQLQAKTKSALRLPVKPACIRSRCNSQPDRDAVAGDVARGVDPGF